MKHRLVRASVVLPGDEPPVRDGAVVVDEDGIIVEVGRAADLVPRHAGAAITEIAGAVLPALVNAHTHLELSALRGKVAGGRGFVAWLESFLAARAAESPEEDSRAIDGAVADLDLYGTAAVGDVTNTLGAVPALARRGMAGTAFHELFGLDRDRTLERLPRMREQRREAERFFSADLTYVPAPHTLYTTHPDVVRALVAEAREKGSRTTLHLAEHPAERSFLEHKTGPFFDFAVQRRLSVENFPTFGEGPIAAADRLGLLAPDVLLVHLADARPRELEKVAAASAPVVICPRSNLFIEVKLPPLPDMLRAGILPALGTDSLASNSSLDVLAEARALHDRFPTVPPWALIRMATEGGARALGRADLGRLARGARPGLLAVEGALGKDDDPGAWVLCQPKAARRFIVRRDGKDGAGSP